MTHHRSLFFILFLGGLATASKNIPTQESFALPEDRRLFIHAATKVVSTMAFSAATAGVLDVRMPNADLQTTSAQQLFALSRGLFEAATQILKRGWPLQFSTKADRRLSFDATPQVLLEFDEKNKPANLKDVNAVDKQQAAQLKDAFWAAMGRKDGNKVQCKLQAQFQREAFKRRMVLSVDQLIDENMRKDSGFQVFKYSLDRLKDLPGRAMQSEGEEKDDLLDRARKFTKGVYDFGDKVKDDANLLSYRLVLKGYSVQGNWPGLQANKLIGLWAKNQISEKDQASDNFIFALLQNLRGQITKQFLVLNDAVGGFQSLIHDQQTKDSFKGLADAIDEFKLAVETEEKQFGDHIDVACKSGHLIRI